MSWAFKDAGWLGITDRQAKIIIIVAMLIVLCIWELNATSAASEMITI